MTIRGRGRDEPILRATNRHSAWTYVAKRWWFVLLGAVAGAGAIPFVATASLPEYEAEAVVGAVTTTIPVEDFDLAPTLFATDRVITPVIENLDLDESRSSLLASGQLESEAVSGGGLKITARSDDPELAVDLANGAAESFESALEIEGIGDFSVLNAQVAASTGEPSEVLIATVGAVAGGALAGLLLLLVYLVRRPMMTEEDALEVLPFDVVLPVTLRVRRRAGRSAPYFIFVFRPAGFLRALKREISSRDETKATTRSTTGFLVVGGAGRSQIGLLNQLGATRQWRKDARAKAGTPFWVESRDPELSEALEQADIVVSIVRQGTPQRHARRVAEELIVSSPDAKNIFVFTRVQRSLRLFPLRQTKSESLPAIESRRPRPLDSGGRPTKST